MTWLALTTTRTGRGPLTAPSPQRSGPETGGLLGLISRLIPFRCLLLMLDGHISPTRQPSITSPCAVYHRLFTHKLKRQLGATCPRNNNLASNQEAGRMPDLRCAQHPERRLDISPFGVPALHR
jgi:hypothetical protein